MEKKTYLIKQGALTKALLYGHFINIVLGIVVFSITHWFMKLSTIESVIATIVATLLMSIVVSLLGTKRVSKPLEVISNEINTLHEQVSSSTGALAETNKSVSALLNNLPVGILVFNKNLELIKHNDYATVLLGVEGQHSSATELVVSSLNELRSDGRSINFTNWLREAKAGKIQDQQTWPLVVAPSKEEVHVFDLMAHYNKHDSHEFELVLLLIDRTEEYDRQEKQMEFISLAAHELRGPITVMRGLIDILGSELDAPVRKQHQELLTRMSISARQLAGYVDNILNVSRVDKDSFEVQQAEGSWPVVIKQLSRDLILRAQANHRSLEFVIPKSLPTVAVDTMAISHVFNNLIDNAIKYSGENGKVIVTVKQKENMVETTVQDFGIGIPANVVDNLFTKFYRSHRSKQIVSGTGLGLYLCKAIVEAHGGNIWVRSTEGAGTTFGFTIPTYESVADQLKSGKTDEGIIRGSHGWIKNHALYRR